MGKTKLGNNGTEQSMKDFLCLGAACVLPTSSLSVSYTANTYIGPGSNHSVASCSAQFTSSSTLAYIGSHTHGPFSSPTKAPPHLVLQTIHQDLPVLYMVNTQWPRFDAFHSHYLDFSSPPQVPPILNPCHYRSPVFDTVNSLIHSSPS
jgi:hypothetical protein